MKGMVKIKESMSHHQEVMDKNVSIPRRGSYGGILDEDDHKAKRRKEFGTSDHLEELMRCKYTDLDLLLQKETTLSCENTKVWVFLLKVRKSTLQTKVIT